MDGELQYDINRVQGKKSALSLGNIDKHNYLTVKEIFSLQQNRVIQNVQFSYSPLEKHKLTEKH